MYMVQDYQFNGKTYFKITYRTNRLKRDIVDGLSVDIKLGTIADLLNSGFSGMAVNLSGIGMFRASQIINEFMSLGYEPVYSPAENWHVFKKADWGLPQIHYGKNIKIEPIIPGNDLFPDPFIDMAKAGD